VLDLIADYDVIVDGADNFPTRYLLNDAALMARKPLVHASILRFEGHASVFLPYEGPCYRCLFPEPPPPDMAPSCGEAGVLGVLCGVMGNIQANEAIKVLLGIGETLSGRLLIYDALAMTFTELKVRRDPECPACGPNAVLEFRDYDAWCAGVGRHSHSVAAAGA
jgi:molybdopterin/thiamine biosynthesis adenylyltransferase